MCWGEGTIAGHVMFIGRGRCHNGAAKLTKTQREKPYMAWIQKEQNR